ncbi:MAG: hypothetical protein MUO63_07800 [Desulfobulbaceae bacterium]|nr:hypothetical protein [Desulfobulbaceae bacterium]
MINTAGNQAMDTVNYGILAVAPALFRAQAHPSTPVQGAFVQTLSTGSMTVNVFALDFNLISNAHDTEVNKDELPEITSNFWSTTFYSSTKHHQPKHQPGGKSQ